SSFASKIDYVKLQSDSTCYLGKIRFPYQNVQLHDSMLFIGDENKILAFNLKGTFLTKFGSQGRGPGEYQDIKNFTVLKQKKKLAIFSTKIRKVLFYDFQGKYLNEINIDFLPLGLVSSGENLILSNPRGRRDKSEYKVLSVMSESGKLQHRIINRQNEKSLEKKGKIGIGGVRNQLYTLKDTIYYWESFYDTIWSISNSYKIVSKRPIFYGDDYLPFKYMFESNTKNIELKELKKYVFIQYFFETGRYMFFELANKGKLNHLIYDKSNGRCLNLNNKEAFGKSTNFSFFNDIDNGLPFWPDGVISENQVFKLIYGYDLKKHFDKMAKSGKGQIPINNSIHNLVTQTKIIDNPIVMIVTLKK
ncbi:MAG: 6-bladed beta-propeller, partial [Candidatus Moranbacteria bacterium]|nr:6-bladed beta-propeller [Candidatus Moranbacteria bacterium]